MPKKLTTYEAKRDFSQTAEPSGDAKVAASRQLRFIVQKHDASRLHYDFRLELDGVFKSWAVTKGPSLDPHERRLAVEVEDHPLGYGDFEGTIPKGQYGGGTVMLWDRGYWAPEGTASAETQLRKGDLKFVLAGKKLEGGWVLVRMRQKERGRNNWLLIKHRDGTEHDNDRDALLAKDLSVASGRTMAAIAAGKGRGPVPFMRRSRKSAKADAVWRSAGAPREMAKRAATPASKAKPVPARADSRMPQFIAPQLSTLSERAPSGADWVHEVKFDGYRIQLRVEHGEAALRTRKGLDWTGKFEAIAKSAARLPDCIIDGEVVALDDRGLPDFAALQAALSEGKSERLIYFAFDLLFEGRDDLRGLPLVKRKSRLQELLGKNSRGQIRYVEHLRGAGDAVVRSACRMSLEGIVSKRLSDSYLSGRAGQWTKTKCRGGHEVVIGGWTDTNGQFRSLLAGVYRGRQLVSVGRVGTGFAREKVEPLMKRLRTLASKKCPFADGRRTGAPSFVQGSARRQTGARRQSRARVQARGSKARRTRAAEVARDRCRAFRRTPGDERRHLAPRQAAVACGRERVRVHQTRPRALFRKRRRMAHAAYHGPAMLYRARAGWHRGTALLSTPCDEGDVQFVR
jgi:bifunctional non-homologous end joining protein LigD